MACIVVYLDVTLALTLIQRKNVKITPNKQARAEIHSV